MKVRIRSKEKRHAEYLKYKEADLERFKRKERAGHLKRRYGMTLEQYDRLLKRQGGKCAICLQPPRTAAQLFVDHNHKTGKIRGLLCASCNSFIGRVGDDEVIAARVAAYLQMFVKPTCSGEIRFVDLPAGRYADVAEESSQAA